LSWHSPEIRKKGFYPLSGEGNMRIQSILDRKGDTVATLRYEANVKQASDLLHRRNTAALVVTKGDAIVGVVSERDIVIALSRFGEPALYMPVGALASGTMVAIGPDSELKAAMSAMMRQRVRYLLVMTNGKLAGLVSSRDIVSHCLDDLAFSSDCLGTTGLGADRAPTDLDNAA
jgi:CBS domain-containing protein